MKLIKKKDVSIGDFLYFIPKEKKFGINHNYIFKIILFDLSKGYKCNWFEVSEKLDILWGYNFFEYLNENMWRNYNLYKLNKKEICKFNKNLVLSKL